jgi:hypothetical protein
VAATFLAVVVSPVEESTPNSSRAPSSLVVPVPGDGDTLLIEGAADGAKLLELRLVRRAVTVDTDETEPFSVGDGMPDWPAMRGIFVGVSLGNDVETFRDEGGGKLGSLNPPFELSAAVATEGDPAIVGSWLRELRREVSECLCMELIV